MRGTISTISCLALLAVATPTLAQSATKIGQHNDWGTYSYQGDSGRVCYVLTVPTDKQPVSLNHGDIYFLVSQRPEQNVSYETQFIASYNFQADSKVRVTIGDRNYTMSTQGSSAWIENPAEEPQLIAAMRAGADMRVQATSGRGNATSYTFSLRGITAALNSIENCR